MRYELPIILQSHACANGRGKNRKNQSFGRPAQTKNINSFTAAAAIRKRKLLPVEKTDSKKNRKNGKLWLFFREQYAPKKKRCDADQGWIFVFFRSKVEKSALNSALMWDLRSKIKGKDLPFPAFANFQFNLSLLYVNYVFLLQQEI